MWRGVCTDGCHERRLCHVLVPSELCGCSCSSSEALQEDMGALRGVDVEMDAAEDDEQVGHVRPERCGWVPYVYVT